MNQMSPDQENAFYADPGNQEPQGPPVRRKPKLSEPVPVRVPDDLLREVRDRAAADDRSVSNWIRRAVEPSSTNSLAARSDLAPSPIDQRSGVPGVRSRRSASAYIPSLIAARVGPAMPASWPARSRDRGSTASCATPSSTMPAASASAPP